jgi:hypothetical protein
VSEERSSTSSNDVRVSSNDVLSVVGCVLCCSVYIVHVVCCVDVCDVKLFTKLSHVVHMKSVSFYFPSVFVAVVQLYVALVFAAVRFVLVNQLSQSVLWCTEFYSWLFYSVLSVLL